MNCETLQALLDHSDLNTISDVERSVVHLHIESCPACAAAIAVHEEFLAMRMPAAPADLEQRCFERVAVARAGRVNRRRAGPFVLGSLVLAAAAAALVGTRWLGADNEAGIVLIQPPADSSSVPSETDAGRAPVVRASESVGTDEGAADAALETAPAASDVTFTVELTRLVPAGQTQMGQQFGDWFHAALIEELSRVPNLVLIEAAGDIEMQSIASDYSSDAAFLFDRDPANWPAGIYIRLAAGAGIEQDGVGDRWTAANADGERTGLSRDSSAMRPGDEAMPAYAVRLASEVVDDLRISLFPADASSLATQFAHFETIAVDVAAEVTERSTALFAAEELARRANDPDITARLVDAILSLAAQIEDGLLNSDTFARFASQASAAELDSARAQFAEAPAGILYLLGNKGDSRVIGPMSDVLLYDQNDQTRRAAASILGEFADEPIARAALESAAARDSSAEVSETANNYLLDDREHLEAIFATVRDTSLSDEERLYSILLGQRLQYVDRGFSVDAETVDVVAELIERSDVPVRREALLLLSSYGRSPSFVPVYLERLRNDPSPEVRADLLEILSVYRSHSGVEEALLAASTEDSAGSVRVAASRMLDEARP